jgi:carboxylesterase type B
VRSDLMIVKSVEFAKAQSAHRPATYMYSFARRSPAGGGLIGAFHGVAGPFFFNDLHEGSDWDEVLGLDPPQELAVNMQRALVSFAATGDPSHASLPPWPRHESARRATMRFDVESKLIEDPESARRVFYSTWNAGER